MGLQVPPDIAMAMKKEMMENNQRYSLAFQLYSTFLKDNVDMESAAMSALEAADVFNMVVARDIKRRKEEK